MSRSPFSVAMHVLLAAAVTSTVGCAADDSEEEASDEAAIVGNDIANDEHPEVVRLSIRKEGGSFVCTGTLVGARTVLTAAHCLRGGIEPDGGCDGRATVDPVGSAPASQIPFERCWRLPSGSARWYNDLALVRLGGRVGNVTPARLAVAAPTGNTFKAYGYGGFGEGHWTNHGCSEGPDGNKRKVTYRGRIGLNADFQQVTCPGDSGGPHFVGTSNVIAGVTSGGGSVAFRATARVFDYAPKLSAMIAEFER